MIYCTKCGTGNPNQAIYCIEDGHALHQSMQTCLTKQTSDMVCHNCGSDQVSGAQYCYFCGESFECVIHKVPERVKPKDHKMNDYKRPLLLAIPFALLCIVFLYVFSAFSLSLTDNHSYAEPFQHDMEDFEQVQWGVSYRYLLDSYQMMKLEATEGAQQVNWNPTVFSALSPVDIMLLGNLGEVYVTFDEVTNQKTSETLTNHTMESKLGLSFYLIITVIAIALAGMLYAFRVKVSDEQDWLIHTISFSFIYSIMMWALSILTDYSMEKGYQTVNEVTNYSYQSWGVMWKSFLISFVVLLSVLSFKKGLKGQSVYAKSIKLASLAAVTIMSLYLVLSGLIIGNVQEESFYQVLIGSSLISSLVLIVQLSVYMLNLSFLNTFKMSGGDFNPEHFQYQILQTVDSSLNNQLIQKGFVYLENYLWMMLVITILVILLYSLSFRKFARKNQTKTIIVYSGFLSLIFAVLTYGSNFSYNIVRAEFSEHYVIGFSLITLLLVSIFLSLITSLIGTKLIKISKKN